ncbi:MAG: ADP-ribosylglycohydrolase family protein, partial [Gammaproteobacteria bacterium]|nr:ADP-ribosylglycohydrolase family protein [Gammaproteobacteria bacterium]
LIKVYDNEDKLNIVYGPEVKVPENIYVETDWIIPNTKSQPIAEIGFECESTSGAIYLDYLTWDGEPDVTLTRPFGSKEPWSP